MSISGAIGPVVLMPRSATHIAFSGLLIAAVAAVGSQPQWAMQSAHFVLAGAVGFPIGGVHQLLEGLGVAFTEQIAGLLPAEDVARRHAPRRALVFLVAGEEVQEEAGMHEVPLLALAERKDVAEQLLGLGAVEEVLLVGRTLIGITGRHRDADAELGGEVEELGDLLGRVAVEDGGVDVDGEAAGLGRLDRGDGAIEHALLRNRLVVMVLSNT